MKILVPVFSPPTGTLGSLTRVLAVANAAKAAGHDIAFCANSPIADKLIKKGYKVYPIPKSTMFGLPPFISRILEAKSTKISLPVKPGKSFGSIWHVLYISGYTNFNYLNKLVDEELQTVKSYRPDVLFTELEPAAFLISRITKIPIVTTYGSVMKIAIDNYHYRKLQKNTNKILKAHNINPIDLWELFFGNQNLKIIPSIPELEENIPNSEDYLFCGSLFHSMKTSNDEVFEIDPQKKYIFVYVGTGSVSQKQLLQILTQIISTSSDTFCVVGGIPNIDKLTIFDNIILHNFIDAESLIPHCQWVICHGGHNTIMQSLKYGIPLIIFPGPIFERRFNARKVQDCGAGVMCELTDLKTNKLKQIFDEKHLYTEKAQYLQSIITSYDGANTVIKSIEAFLSQKGKNL